MTDGVAEKDLDIVWIDDPAGIDVGVRDIMNNLLNGVRLANNGGE